MCVVHIRKNYQNYEVSFGGASNSLFFFIHVLDKSMGLRFIYVQESRELQYYLIGREG